MFNIRKQLVSKSRLNHVPNIFNFNHESILQIIQSLAKRTTFCPNYCQRSMIKKCEVKFNCIPALYGPAFYSGSFSIVHSNNRIHIQFLYEKVKLNLQLSIPKEMQLEGRIPLLHSVTRSQLPNQGSLGRSTEAARLLETKNRSSFEGLFFRSRGFL